MSERRFYDDRGIATLLLTIAIAAVVISFVVVFVVPRVQTAVDEANLPIEGRMKFIRAVDVVSYGTVGKPPCLEIHDYDCITSYEYAITDRNGDIYRLDTEQFLVRLENNTAPKYKDLSNGGVVAISCEYLSPSSRDHQRNMSLSSWDGMTISNRNYFFGCEIVSPGEFLT